MSRRHFVLLLVCIGLVALSWPPASSADHIKTSATVSAQLKARKSADSWIVDIRWTAGCQGAAPGKAWFAGDLYLVDVETSERIYTGAVTSASGRANISGNREWTVVAKEREQRLRPELTIYCYESFPLHGGPEITVTGDPVLIPRAFGSGGGGGGGGGGAGGDYGSGDPTAPLASGGCGNAFVGTNAPEVLTGTDQGDVIFGFAGNDRIRGRRDHDCLIGGSGNDRLSGERGNDRLTGGRGRDVLLGGPGRNAYDAGPGNDYVNARNRRRELVRCGRGRDRARVDRRDRVRSCERVSRGK